jgi:hypothetical protein
MTEPKPGDRVRVTETVTGGVQAVRNGEIDILVHGGGHRTVSTVGATVEVIQPADDPSEDPVGTVRENTGGYGGGYVRTKLPGSTDPVWLHTVQGFTASDDDVTLGPIVGVVPGTPAAEAQKPAKVRVFKDSDGDYWYEREPDSFAVWWGEHGGGWSYSHANHTLEQLQRRFSYGREVEPRDLPE